jgi:hypothetical protein
VFVTASFFSLAIPFGPISRARLLIGALLGIAGLIFGNALRLPGASATPLRIHYVACQRSAVIANLSINFFTTMRELYYQHWNVFSTDPGQPAIWLTQSQH